MMTLTGSFLRRKKMNKEELLLDLYDIRNMAKFHKFGKLPKDNDGSMFTINDLLNNAIEKLEEDE